MSEKKLNFICIFICLLSFYVHFFTNFDIRLQKNFYYTNEWLIDPCDEFFYSIFYVAPKGVTIFLGLISLSALFVNKFYKSVLSLNSIKCLLVVICTLVFFPLLINILKDVFRQPCPRDLVIFGGVIDITFLNYFLNRGELKCFPGAHASTAFSLLAFKYFFIDGYNRRLFLMFLLPIASIVAFYQVLRGVHFISDIIFTAALSQVFVSIVYSNIKLSPNFCRFVKASNSN